MKNIIQKINYSGHLWKICADLKVISLLRGLQTGYTKNMCYLCIWDTRYNGNQYQKSDWPARGASVLHQANVMYQPLVPVDKVLLPPLHIKLGIVKNFIKALRKKGNERAMQRLTQIFPRLSQGKIKEGKISSI